MEKPSKYDFSGWATKYNLKCSDGRTILHNAFKDKDGTYVPLVWNHNHDAQNSVLGKAYLEHKDEGVYVYGSFNETEEGQRAKELVKHRDVVALSIYANQLKQNSNKEVIHGNIREVSLVLAGANPGAYIETVIEHSDTSDEEAIISVYDDSDEGSLEISHACGDKKPENKEEPKKEPEKKKSLEHSGKTVQQVFDEMTEEQKQVVYLLVGLAAEKANKDSMNHSDNDNEEIIHANKIVDEMTDEQKQVVNLLVEAAEKGSENQNVKEPEIKHTNTDSQEGGKETMKNNVFEGIKKEDGTELTHSEMITILEDAKRLGSVKEAFLQHSITDISNFFPEVQAVNKEPFPIARRMDWVSVVMNSVKHTPFSRVKSTAANMTADAARAKGYVKGNAKVEEVLVALKRSTTPQTVYKLQKLDRDDILDITDFDVLVWIKKEMRMLLEEEAARAILIGDGRSAASNDKIDPTHIRPIWGDSNVYTTARTVARPANTDDYAYAKLLIKDIIKSRKLYKGSGNPVLFTTEDDLTNMLLIEDLNQRVIYDSVEKLKTALRVSDIITVPVMEGVYRDTTTKRYYLHGILVNLADYNVGADKGGNVSFFEDFDIDYNKEKYLIETRFSGALVKPYSAIVYEEETNIPESE